MAPTSVFADTYSVSGNVTGVNYGTFENVSVSAVDSTTQAVIATDTTDTNGDYSLAVEEGSYDIVATPPDVYQYKISRFDEQTVTGNTVLNFVLDQTIYYTFGGIISDNYGEPVEGITVQAGGNSAVTDENGYYYMTLPEYTTSITPVMIASGHNSPYMPQNYTVYATQSVPFYGDVQLDMKMPATTVTVTVADEESNPVEGATVTAYTSAPTSTDKEFEASTNGGGIILAIDDDAIMGQGITGAEGSVEFVTFPVGLTFHTEPSLTTLLDAWVPAQRYTEQTIIPVTLLNAPEE